MDTPQLIVKLSGYGISLCVRDQKLVYSSETPIPKGIALTISAHEKKLLSYLASNKGDFRASELESHDLSKVPDQTQTNPTPLFNKGTGKLADKVCYRPANETASRGSKVVHQADNLVNVQRVGHLHLPSILLKNLMAWVAKFHELRLEHPNGVTINATPEHVRDAVKLHSWGVVYDPERYLLMSWGDVPTVTLLGLRDLETSELLIPGQAAA